MILSILHSFLNIFAGGRSEIKIFIFLSFSIVLILSYFLKRKIFFKKIEWYYFGVTLLAMYIYGLCLHIYLVLSQKLSLFDFIITVNNDEISSSIIYHTHVAKGIIGQFFSFLNINQFKTMDAGGAYLGIIHPGIFIFGLIILIILIIQSFYYFLVYIDSFLVDKNKRQKFFLIFGYLILSFSLIKTSIDGGIFSPAFILGATFVLIFILRLKQKGIAVNYYYYATLIGVLMLFIGLFIENLNIVYFSTLFFLYILIFYGSENKINWIIFSSLLILFFMSWWTVSYRDRIIYNYGNRIIKNDQRVYIYNDNDHKIDTLELNKPEKIINLSRQLNKNITYFPVSIPGVTCMEKSRYQKFSAIIYTDLPVEKNIISDSSLIHFKKDLSYLKEDKWKTRVTVYIDPCVPERLSFLTGELSKNLTNSYLLVNLNIDGTFNY